MFGSIISWKAYFETHIVYVKRLVLGALRRFKLFVPLYNLGNLYNSHAQPYFDYCYLLWDTCGKQLKDKLQKIQNRAGRVITGSSYDIRSVDVLIFLCNFFFAYKNVFFSTLLSNKFNKNKVGSPVVSASGKFVWYPDLPVLSCHRSDMMNLCHSICLVYGVLK